MKFLILTGQLGSGKDFIANRLAKELEEKGFTVEKGSFGDEVKEDLSKMLNINENEFYGNKTFERRKQLIEYAEGMKEKFGQDYWARRFITNLEVICDYFIITDMRFLSEYEAIKKYTRGNFFIIRIKSNERYHKKLTDETNNSEDKVKMLEENEKEINDIPTDYIFENTEHLSYNISKLLYNILK